MTMAVALFEREAGGSFALGPSAMDALARLGVTNVSVLRDDDGVAVVMEGWAFEPRGAQHALAVVAPASTLPPRILYPLSDITVRPADRKGVPT